MHELTHCRAFDQLRPAGSGEGVTAVERVGLGIAAILLRRGKFADLEAAMKRHYGVKLADAPARHRFHRSSFLGTGKGRWLAVRDPPSGHFVEELGRELDGLASVVDQSDAFGILRLSGPKLLATLEKGVQLNLAPDVFEAGCVALTNIAHIGAVLWKVDDTPTIDIAVARSLANSFCHWLETSAAIHGLAVHQRPAPDWSLPNQFDGNG